MLRKKVLDKAVSAIVYTLDQFNSNDWDKINDYYNNDISLNEKPNDPIDINCNFERQYRVRNNSDRYNDKIRPLVEKIKAATQQTDYQTALDVGKQYKALSNFTVYAYINRNNASVTDTGVTRITVNGVPLAYHTNQGYYDNFTNSYWLLFGNWTTAKPGQYGLNFHFNHPNKTPYIENIVIISEGADDRIKELLKTVNWSEVQNGLTP